MDRNLQTKTSSGMQTLSKPAQQILRKQLQLTKDPSRLPNFGGGASRSYSRAEQICGRDQDMRWLLRETDRVILDKMDKIAKITSVLITSWIFHRGRGSAWSDRRRRFGRRSRRKFVRIDPACFWNASFRLCWSTTDHGGERWCQINTSIVISI